jgi:predicted heme/steroid binding protein
MNFNNFMIKLDRWAAWLLLAVVLAYGITGYGMTRGLINRDLAASLHLDWLGSIGLVALVIHAGWAIHLALIRWKIWNKFFKIILIIFFLALALFFTVVHFFYKKNIVSDYSNSESNNSVGVSGKASDQSGAIFNAETLALYNGKNDQPSYVAINGLVYDVSSLYRNGEHMGCRAGADITGEFYAKHFLRILDRFSVVGTYQTN